MHARIAHEAAELERVVASVEADVVSSGRGPAARRARPVDRATLVLDGQGKIVAVVRWWEDRKGLGIGPTLQARRLDGETWQPSAAVGGSAA